MAIYNLPFVRSLKQRFREKRFAFFLKLLQTVKSNAPLRILDVGGTELFWERMNFSNSQDIQITLLNLKAVATKNSNFKSIKGDACDLSMFKDREFDIVFSNSVIEHLFSIDNQLRMANETRRVGKNYYVQTPNYYFAIEPHWLFPFFQFLPVETRIFLTRNFDLGSYKKAPDRATAARWVQEVNLLTEREMKKLFPDGTVYREQFMGMTKSITLYRFSENQSDHTSDKHDNENR
jgi:hypothetical protein